MNGIGGVSLLVLLAACHVYGDVQTSTPCSLSFYRYLFNLPGEQIRPNVPEGTYLFGKRVAPAAPEGQASNVEPSVLRPAPSYEAPQYLPPPTPTTTTTTTTTTARPSTSAPLYIPPASPYRPEASNEVAQAVLPAARPTCDHPEHQHDVALLPPTYQPLQPAYQPQPSIAVPKFAVPPKYETPTKFVAPPQFARFVAPPQFAAPVRFVAPPQFAATENEVYVAPPQKPATFRYPVPTPPPQFLQPYVQPSVQPSPAVHENCVKHRPVPTTTTTTTTTTVPPPPPPPTTAEAPVETRQNEVIAPAPAADCAGHKKNVQVLQPAQSADYGVIAPAPSGSAGYSYDKPAVPFGYPSAPANAVTGYAYPKPSPSFEYPTGGGGAGYAAQGTARFESESPEPSAAADDADLVVLKV